MGSLLSIAGIVLLAALSAGGVAYALLAGRIREEDQTLNRVAQIQTRATNPVSAARTDPTRRRKSVQDTLNEMEERQKAQAKRSSAPPLPLRLEQAGLDWSKRTFFMFSAACGLFAFVVVWLAGAPAYVALLLAFAGGAGLPRWYVNRRRNKRIKRFLDEFPNAVDVIVRGIKAGLPLNDSIRTIAAETVEPLKTEFRMITESQGFGVSLADAVLKLPERVPVPEANFFAIVVAIQQKSGGNLAEALGNLSRVLRERKRMKGKITAMSMEAKASAAIIGVLPVVVMMLTYISSPAYIMLLFTDPLGNAILIGSAIWMTLGVIVMKKMINFDF